MELKRCIQACNWPDMAGYLLFSRMMLLTRFGFRSYVPPSYMAPIELSTNGRPESSSYS